ncbi:MAG: hypothetical protein FWG70_00790 [Oscillospiraceae bacterium]|nr:hypothetical protein [Oscillospiraceae bacterium]
MKFIQVILALIFVISIGAGCDNNGNGDDIGETDITAEPDPEPTPYPLFVHDTEITRSPERVVSLSPSLTEIIHELGYGSRIIGRSSYCDFPPIIRQMPVTGSGANPDIDMIITLSPYLVLTTMPLSAKDMFLMERHGIKTLTIPACISLSDLRDSYRAVGLVFEGLFTGMDAGDSAFSDISRVCDNRSVVNIGKYIYITGDLKAATGDTLESAIFSCFGENIAKDGEDYEFDFELLIENEPDIILLSDIYEVGDLLALEHFSELNAILENKVILIDNSVFERPSSRLVPVIEKMLEDYRKIAD